ncbi:MAG TPA: SusC/RagA family TonB-linked outer membrane protein [Gemmatimonadaceae bacterium]|nr:SusC/RagA family TonB-linked outer membrane protein [Gemmatimonadaceae bacterium]
MRTRRGLPVLVLLLALSASIPGAILAQGRVVTGTVTDSATGAPLVGASVAVRGTTIGAPVGEAGRFRLANVPAGDVRLTVRMIGYRPGDVLLAAGQTEVRVALVADPLRLGEVVVTGQATTVQRRNLANAVATVSGEDVTRVSSESVEHALQGKVAGAVISTNSGAPGGGVQVRLRGVTSINAQSDPLYVVDGVVLSNVAIPSNQNAVTNAAGGSNPSLDQDAQVNRIADLNPNDIESVEVLKGASASAIYGSRASNGVVIITTRRGRAGRAELRAAQRFGFSKLSNTLGSRRFETVDEAVAAFGESARDYFQPGVAYDHEKELAGRTPLSFESTVDVSGGSETTRYYVSGGWKDDGGIIRNTGFERQALRVNLGHRFGSRVDLDAGANVIRTVASRGLTNNDNASVSFYMVFPSTPSFVNLQQRPDGTYPDNPFVASNPLQTAALMRNDETVWRYIGSGQLSVDAWRTESQSLRFVGVAGADYFTQKNDLFFPPELQFEPDDGEPGTSLLSNSDNLNLNLGLSGIHSFATAGDALTATTSFGTNYAYRDLDIARIVSRNLVGGLDIVGAGTNVQVLEQRQRVKDFGLFAQEEVLLGGRLLLTAGVNADRSSVNSDDEKLFVYPKFAGSYLFERPVRWVDQFKVRAAYGESGNQPLYGQKFTPLTATQNIAGLPGLLVEGTVGSDDLKPERQREVEGGFDAVLLDSRGTLEFTLFRKSISDLLLERTLAASSGFATEIFNGGRLRTSGVEVALGVVPAATDDLNWLLRTTFSSTKSKIVELPVPIFRAGGFGTALGAYQIEEGASATQIVGNDSLPDGSRIVRKVGDATPDFTMSFSSDVTWRRFRLYGLVDWQQGGDIINLTKFLYDLAQNTADYADPITVGDRETTVGAYRLEVFGNQTAVYLEDASFVKLREVTLSYELPPDLLGRVWGTARTARLSLSGRNLLTFTDYTGLDPEVSNFGNQNIARNIDVAPFPPSRSFWFGVEIGF